MQPASCREVQFRVGVHPDHRRRGLLTAMLSHHFEQTRREGGHLSGLHASEADIYGRHGYGLASLELQVQLGRGSTLTAPHLEDEVATIPTRLGTVDDEGMAERRRRVDLDLMATNVGTIVGAPAFYDELTLVDPEEIRDSEPPRLLPAEWIRKLPAGPRSTTSCSTSWSKLYGGIRSSLAPHVQHVKKRKACVSGDGGIVRLRAMVAPQNAQRCDGMGTAPGPDCRSFGSSWFGLVSRDAVAFS